MAGFMAEISKREEKFGVVHLDVIAYNMSAICYYEKIGFKTVAFLDQHYVLDE